jgi:spore germination protein YaaH
LHGIFVNQAVFIIFPAHLSLELKAYIQFLLRHINATGFFSLAMIKRKTMRRSRFSLFIMATLATVVSTPSLWALGRRPPKPVAVPEFGGWVVYWDANGGEQAVSQWGGLLKEISLFAYQFNEMGQLGPATGDVQAMQSSITKNAAAWHPRLLMTAVNDIATNRGVQLKDAACVHRAIATPEVRAAHIRQLLTIAEGLDGIEIDYERLGLEDRQAFSAFIKELAKELHKRRQWLSVVVQPRTAETADNDTSGAGVIDWVAITPHVDRIKVMAYLYHYSASEPGSIAPIAWISQLAEYALRTVPPEKLCVVLHQGGFDWPDMSPGRSVEYEQAQALAEAHHERIQTDDVTQSGYFQYANESHRTHLVWIENAEGLKAKVQILAHKGVPSIAFWRLGRGDPELPKGLPGLFPASAFGDKVLFVDHFNRPDGLVTNEFAYWHRTDPSAVKSPYWEMDSGSFFIQQNTGWTGIPDDTVPNAASSNGSHSAVFRLDTTRSDFGNIAVDFSLLNQGLTATPSTPAMAWDGLHVWVRYQNEYNLYYASINRRDGTSVIKKKVPGGPSNRGTYYELSDYVPHPVPYNTWQDVRVTVRDNADGSVTICLYDDGRQIVCGTDRGAGGVPPIHGTGKVGLRGDNANLKFRDFVVHAWDANK